MTPNLICGILIGLFAFGNNAFPSLLTSLSSDSMEQGLLLTALLFLFPFASWISGTIADRIGKPPVLLSGCLLMAAPFFIGSLFSGIYPLSACVLFFGAGGGIVESQATAYLCDLNPGRERSVVSMSQFLFTLGAMLGPFIIASAFRLVPGLSTTAVLLSVGCVILIGVPFLFSMRNSTRPAHHAIPNSAVFSKLRFSRELLLYGVALFLYVAVEAGVSGWVVVYGVERFNLPLATAPLLLTGFWMGQALSRLLFARIPPHLPGRTLLLLCMAGMLVFLLIALSVAHATLFGVAVFLLAFTMGGYWPTLIGMVGVRFSANSGTAVGIIAGFGALGASLVQVAVGALAKISFLGLRGALFSLAILIIFNLVLTWRMERGKCADELA